MIGYRRGFGDLVADGVMRAAERIGRGSERYAMHIKGSEIPAYDPRGSWGMALAYEGLAGSQQREMEPHNM
jgi:aldehyde:ferredoxin oxidoreductase